MGRARAHPRRNTTTIPPSGTSRPASRRTASARARDRISAASPADLKKYESDPAYSRFFGSKVVKNADGTSSVFKVVLSPEEVKALYRKSAPAAK